MTAVPGTRSASAIASRTMSCARSSRSMLAKGDARQTLSTRSHHARVSSISRPLVPPEKKLKRLLLAMR